MGVEGNRISLVKVFKSMLMYSLKSCDIPVSAPLVWRRGGKRETEKRETCVWRHGGHNYNFLHQWSNSEQLRLQQKSQVAGRKPGFD